MSGGLQSADVRDSSSLESRPSGWMFERKMKKKDRQLCKLQDSAVKK